ncbi:MAG TPA: hypothetical protein VFY06_03175 [Verrucomicrobiae bacterium]|nr:hypothetical protein [Verrucomicrobiae bacterium]
MTTKTRKWLVTILILAFPFVLFLGFLIFMEEPPPPLPALPNPNGYADLVKAGAAVHPDTGNYDTMGEAQLKKIVSANAAALSLARAGMSNQCGVPVQYSLSYTSNHLNDLTAMKRLAQAFVAEGTLAEMEGRTNDAVQSFLDTIHLGIESSQGGALIDELVGMAIQAIGTSQLQTLVPDLDARTCREAASALSTLDSQKQTWTEVMQQESDWSHGTFRGWQYDLLRWRTRKKTAAENKTMHQKFLAQERKPRQLILDLAARAYELDKGRRPASAADLVPEYLEAVPTDPVTDTNMIYP